MGEIIHEALRWHTLPLTALFCLVGLYRLLVVDDGDRTIDNSRALCDVRDTFFNRDPDYFKTQIVGWIDQFGIGSANVGEMMKELKES
jgi:hypothetical protein